jgi:hypothetical protein
VDDRITRFKARGCRNYEQLGILFDRSTVTGILRRSSAQSPPDTNEEERLMHRMHTEGIHMHSGGAGRTGRAEGNPSQAFVDLCNPDDDQVSGPSFGGGGCRGKEPMVEDSWGNLARDIGLGITLGSTQKGSSGKKSSRQTKSAIVASKQALYDELREMAKARKDFLLRRSQPDMSSTQHHSTAKSALPIDRALDLLDKLQHEVSDEVYVAATVALMDEQLQAAWIRMTRERRLIWLKKQKPMD